MGGRAVIEIHAESLASLAKVLAAANADLERELAKGGARTAKAVTVAAKDSARSTLPRRGGLGRRIAGSKFTTRRQPRGVQVIATSADSLRLIDRKGIIRHPVFGNREVWVSQPVPAHWFTRPTEAVGKNVGHRELVRATDNVARKIDRAA